VSHSQRFQTTKGYVIFNRRGGGDDPHQDWGVTIPHKIGILTPKKGKIIKILKELRKCCILKYE